MPLGRRQIGILGAEKPAEVGHVGIVETFVVVIREALITPADLIEEDTVDASVDLNLADADDVLPIRRRSHAAAEEVERKSTLHGLSLRIA